jgi:hypothetical protein
MSRAAHCVAMTPHMWQTNSGAAVLVALILAGAFVMWALFR